jgi:FkbM family methyltransferase
MYISFDYLCKNYGTPKGVIHIGAHLLEERDAYLRNGIKKILWVEGNPSIFNQISSINDNNNIEYEKVVNHIISDVDDVEYDFKITNNGQSSSILDLDRHKIFHPEVSVVSSIKLKSKRMDTLIEEISLNIDNFNFINLDIQGVELLALKGFGDLLNKIDFVYTEVNVGYVYKDCALITEIDEYLSSFGFSRTETHLTEMEWGDAFYVKKYNK